MIGTYINTATSERLEHLVSMSDQRFYSEMVASAASEPYEELVSREGLIEANSKVKEKIEDELGRRRRDKQPRSNGYYPDHPVL